MATLTTPPVRHYPRLSLRRRRYVLRPACTSAANCRHVPSPSLAASQRSTRWCWCVRADPGPSVVASASQAARAVAPQVPCCLDKRTDFGLKALARERGRDPFDLKVEELRAQLTGHAANVIMLRDRSMRTNAGGESEHAAKNSILIASRRPPPPAQQQCLACDAESGSEEGGRGA